MCGLFTILGLIHCRLEGNIMIFDAETLSVVTQILTTAGISILGIRGMIAALTLRVERIETDLAELRARYAVNHPVPTTTPIP